jgi:hypothetical protein
MELKTIKTLQKDQEKKLEIQITRIILENIIRGKLRLEDETEKK